MIPEPAQILLVEDDDAHAELVRLSFSKKSKELTLFRASTVVQALELLETGKFELIISDWRLPDGEAPELIEKVKEKHRIPVLVVTSYGQDRAALAALKAGAMDYMVKGEESFLNLPDIAAEAILKDRALSEGRRALNLLSIQQNLEIALQIAYESKVAVRLFLNSTSRIEGLEIGLAYLLDHHDGDFKLIHHYGFSLEQVPEEVLSFRADSAPARLLQSGQALFTDFSGLLKTLGSPRNSPRFKAAAILPLVRHGKILGVLGYLSEKLAELPLSCVGFLETASLRLASRLAGMNTEKELDQTESSAQGFFSAWEDPVFIVNGEGRLLFQNTSAENRFGYTTRELTGKNFFSLTPPDFHKKAGSFFQEASQAQAGPIRITLATKNGTAIPVEALVRKWRWSGREVLVIVGRESIPAPSTARQTPVSVDNLRHLIENAPIGIFHTTLSGKPLLVNPAAARLTGFASPEEILADQTLNASQLYPHPENRNKLVNLALDARDWFSQEGELIRKDGRTIMIKSRFRVVRDESGAPQYIEGFIEDITQSRMAEEALRRSERKYRGLYESMRDGFCEVDNNKKIIDTNSVFQKMVGYTQEELTRLTLNDITPEEWRELGNVIYTEQVLPRGYSQVHEKEYRRKDGTLVPVELRIHLIRDENGLPIGRWSIIRDITERKRVESDLNKAKEHAEKGQRDQSLFWADMSRKIKPALNQVIGLTDRTIRTGLTDEQKNLVGSIKNYADRLCLIVDDLPAHPGIQSGDTDITDAPWTETDEFTPPAEITTDVRPPLITEQQAQDSTQSIKGNARNQPAVVRSRVDSGACDSLEMDFDLDESLDRYEGEAIILKEIIDTYLSHLPIKIQALEEGLSQDCPLAVERAAHGIKGGAAYIGAVKIRKLAQTMEHTAKSKDLSVSRELMPVLRRAVEAYRRAVLKTDWPKLIGEK